MQIMLNAWNKANLLWKLKHWGRKRSRQTTALYDSTAQHPKSTVSIKSWWQIIGLQAKKVCFVICFIFDLVVLGQSEEPMITKKLKTNIEEKWNKAWTNTTHTFSKTSLNKANTHEYCHQNGPKSQLHS